MSSSSNLKKMPASSSSASPTTDVVFVHFRRGGAVTAPMPLLKTPHADGKPTTECLAQCEMVWVKQDCTKSGDTGWVQVQSVKRSQKVGWVKRDYLRQPETRVALADIEGTKFTEGDDVVLLDDDGEGVCSIMDGKGGVAEIPSVYLAPPSDDENDSDDGQDSDDSDLWEADESTTATYRMKASKRLAKKEAELAAQAADPGLLALARLAESASKEDEEEDDDDHDEARLRRGETTATTSSKIVGAATKAPVSLNRGGRGQAPNGAASSSAGPVVHRTVVYGQGSTKISGSGGNKSTKPRGGAPALGATNGSGAGPRPAPSNNAKSDKKRADIFESLPDPKRKKRKADTPPMKEEENDAGGLFSD